MKFASKSQNLIRSFALSAVFTLVSALPAFAQDFSSQDRDWSKLIEATDAVSEEALGGADDGSVVGSSDCQVDDQRVAELDEQLELNSSQVDDAISTHLPWGIPELGQEEQQFVHEAYVLVHNSKSRQPSYAIYRLDRGDVVSRDRKRCFRPDERVPANGRAELIDYVEFIFDRGHLVPRADMNRSDEVMLNTFLLSNIMPQHGPFNSGTWRMLESLVRAWAKDKGEVYVATGPVFDADNDGKADPIEDSPTVEPTNRLAIPSHFYKIVLHQTPNGFIETISVMLRHNDRGVSGSTSRERKKRRLQLIENSIVSIDEIERATGRDFFSRMNDSKERAVERSIAPGLWES